MEQEQTQLEREIQKELGIAVPLDNRKSAHATMTMTDNEEYQTRTPQKPTTQPTEPIYEGDPKLDRKIKVENNVNIIITSNFMDFMAVEDEVQDEKMTTNACPFLLHNTCAPIYVCDSLRDI